jgi:hypothetical protein
MTIDQAYQIVLSIANKEQRGYINPRLFNLWAPVAQIEAVSARIGNVKKLDQRNIPMLGYKINEHVKNQIRQLLVGPVALAVSSSVSPYPSDYWYLDSIQTTAYKPITPIDTDELARQIDSAVFPPTTEYPICTFYGSGVSIRPTTVTVLWTYLRYPVDPKWNYTLVSGLPVYSSVGSQDFEVDRDLHTEIVWRICKYAGMNIEMADVVQMAMVQEQQGD